MPGRVDPALVSYDGTHVALLPQDHWVSVLVTRNVFASSRPSRNRTNHGQSQKKILGSQWEQISQICQAPVYVLKGEGDAAHDQISKLSSQAIRVAFCVNIV